VAEVCEIREAALRILAILEPLITIEGEARTTVFQLRAAVSENLVNKVRQFHGLEHGRDEPAMRWELLVEIQRDVDRILREVDFKPEEPSDRIRTGSWSSPDGTARS
jgi:hypothetical protein